MPEYEVISQMSNISTNTKDIISDCMSIAFRNQGTSTVKISVNTSGGAYVVLKAGEERSYSLIAPNMKYKGKYLVEFGATGTNDLLIEKEYVQKITSCK